ncbi:MAG: ADP-ribosylglycohydrolase family protein [Rhodospirillales bacterium]|nr:ADP-ribosylglycohydrolase family protein [Rhodospirillales bacterium]
MARKGAVETSVQEAYVLHEPFSVPDDGCADRVLGCLLGGVVGDAFGYGVEFIKLPEIRRRFGPRGIQQPVLNPHGEAEVSDDTQMTLFTLEGLFAGISPNDSINQAKVLEAVRLATLDWHGAQIGRNRPRLEGNGLWKYAILRKNQAPGMTCMRACQDRARGTPDQPINNSKGCGGVMRVAPIGLFAELSHEQAFELAARCAAQTHSHPSGYLSTGFMASMVRDLLEGLDPYRSAQRGLDLVRNWQDAEETVAAVELAMELTERSNGDPAGAVERIGAGWIGEEALAIALYSALVASNYSEAMSIASNHDGDSGSTASIAGQIYGAWKGPDEIPNAWIRRLDALDPLLDVMERLIRLRG